MSLQELQSSISLFPRTDRDSLLRFLGRQLADETQSQRRSAVSVDRSQWVVELRQLRERLETAHPGAPLSEMLDDLREESTGS